MGSSKTHKIGIVIDPHLMERACRCRSDNYMETALAKLEYVAENNDYVIIAGDLFHIHNNSTLFFNTVYTLFNKYRGKFHAIPGNHDVFNRNISALNKTTLGSLFYTGVLELHTHGWDLCGIHFEPALVDQDPETIPVDKDNKNILIAHKYYDNGFTPEESLTPDDVRRLNYNIIFLGHDHKPYDEDFIGNSFVIRMGSLTRIDTQKYNKDREIVYYQLTVNSSGEYEYERKVIPHKSSKDCYVDVAYKHMCSTGLQKPEISFVKLGDVLERLTKQSTGSNSLERTLRKLGASDAIVSEIKWRHEINDVQFT